MNNKKIHTYSIRVILHKNKCGALIDRRKLVDRLFSILDGSGDLKAELEKLISEIDQ